MSVVGHPLRPLQSTSSRVDSRYIVATVAVAIAYFGAAKFGLSLAFTTKQVTAVWPPTGIALVALLLLGRRVWPGIFLGAFLANVTSAETMLTATGIAVGNTLTGLIGATLLRNRLSFHVALERVRDVLGLVAIAALSTLVSASVGTMNLELADIVTWPTFWSVWWVWWVGDTLGILLVAPFLLTWSMRPRVQWRDRRLMEFGILFIALSIVSYFAFARPLAIGQPYHSMVYSTFPFLIWAAFRFGQREVVTSTLIISTFAIWGAIHDHGPFTVGTLDERLLFLDTFAGVSGVTALLLGAATAERRRSQERLRRVHKGLEHRVKQRTADLERANEELYEFSYSMSHDLRAPLRAVNAFSQLLTQKQAVSADGEESRLLQGIARNSARMGQMIDDYLHLLRLRNQPLNIKTIDANALVRDVLDALQAEKSTHNPHVNVWPLPAAAGDYALIRQVMLHLLDNAVKFTRHCQQPTIEVGGNANGHESTFYVKDNGIGFDMQWSDQLFKVFQRLHPREYEGMGMGLATVARIVQLHGGQVRAVGGINEGATFTFTLPDRDLDHDLPS